MRKYPAKIFYCYSHKDEELRNRLEIHLKMMERQNMIKNWHDRKIVAGRNWENEISKKLDTSDIVLLLLSPDFLASDYCYEIEMKKALSLHNQNKIQVVPIILRICDWKNSHFSKLQGLPLDMIPVLDNKWNNTDEAFYNISEGLKGLIQDLFDSYAVEDKIFDEFKIEKFSFKDIIHESEINKNQFLELDYSELRKAVLVLRSVNHKLRQRIMEIIYEKKSVTVTDVYENLRLERTVASQHLAILKRGGLLKTKRKGALIYYSLVRERIKTIAKGIEIINNLENDE